MQFLHTRQAGVLVLVLISLLGASCLRADVKFRMTYCNR